MKKPRWTEAEDQYLREIFMKHGMKEACNAFIDRSESAIKNRVFLLRLRRNK